MGSLGSFGFLRVPSGSLGSFGFLGFRDFPLGFLGSLNSLGSFGLLRVPWVPWLKQLLFDSGHLSHLLYNRPNATQRLPACCWDLYPGTEMLWDEATQRFSSLSVKCRGLRNRQAHHSRVLVACEVSEGYLGGARCGHRQMYRCRQFSVLQEMQDVSGWGLEQTARI